MPSQLAAYLNNLQRFGIRPGLDRVRALLESAGNPEKTYPVILVGGTNGKGSTSEFLARRLSAHGRIGLYTSPHLYRWNERMRLIESPHDEPLRGAATDFELDALLRAGEPHISRVAAEHGQPTEFEILTFLGFWHFARSGVAAAVVEVGLGGTWDATNVTDPVVSVVTHVALDHCDRLGNTHAEIAADKAGIARAGRALVTAETNPESLRVLQDKCAEIGARLVRVPAVSEADTEADLAAAPDLPAWQRINARTAATAAREVEQALGWQPWSGTISYAVAGRAEIIHQNPTVILDGANNPDGAENLATHLAARFPGRRFTFVVGFSSDKDWHGMLDAWRPLAARWIATQADNPRAAAAQEIDAALHDEPCEVIPDVSQAAAYTLQTSAPEDIIVIAGSFYMLAEVDRDALAQLSAP